MISGINKSQFIEQKLFADTILQIYSIQEWHTKYTILFKSAIRYYAEIKTFPSLLASREDDERGRLIFYSSLIAGARMVWGVCIWKINEIGCVMHQIWWLETLSAFDAGDVGIGGR